MAVHDTIGDFITVIRNAGSAGKSTCQYPHSNLRAGIATILRDRGFVEKVSETEAESGIKNITIFEKADGVGLGSGVPRPWLAVAPVAPRGLR